MFGVWKKAAGRVMTRHVFFIELLYSLKYKEDEAISTAATDGRTVYANPRLVASLEEDEQLFVLLHEFLHVVMLHPFRRGGRKPTLWNAACDYAANLILSDMRLIPPSGDILLDEKFRGMSAEQIYDLLEKEGREFPGLVVDLLEPEGSPEEIQKAVVEAKLLVARCAENARAAGRLPEALESLVSKSLEEVREPWYSHLQRFLQASVNSGMTWERINRRAVHTLGILAPDNTSFAAGKLAILVDTSGSCYLTAQQNFFCVHVNAILRECNPEEVRVYYFDTQVNGCEKFLRGEVDVTLRPTGSGGTDFRNIFNEVAADGYEPVAAIVLTDLYGPTGAEPEYPVIWAITSDESAPFGDSVYVRSTSQ